MLTAAMLIDHVRSRRSTGAGPATVGNDLTWIGVVLRAAKSVEALPLNSAVVEAARTACRELRLVGKSKRRDRRPTPDELTRFHDYFGRRDGRAQIPMHPQSILISFNHAMASSIHRSVSLPDFRTPNA